MSDKSKRASIADVIRAEIAEEDLQEDNEGIIVCAKREDGTLYSIGRVSASAVLQDPSGSKKAIDRIKTFAAFGRY